MPEGVVNCLQPIFLREPRADGQCMIDTQSPFDRIADDPCRQCVFVFRDAEN